MFKGFRRLKKAENMTNLFAFVKKRVFCTLASDSIFLIEGSVVLSESCALFSQLDPVFDQNKRSLDY